MLPLPDGVLPVTVKLVFSCLAPGQYRLYFPPFTLTENDPENPGGRFSFSPTIRSPLCNSTSLTAVASLLVTVNVNAPAGALVVLGMQPSADVIVTAIARGFADELEPPAPDAALFRSELLHAARAAATARTVTLTARRRTDEGYRRFMGAPGRRGRRAISDGNILGEANLTVSGGNREGSATNLGCPFRRPGADPVP